MCAFSTNIKKYSWFRKNHLGSAEEFWWVLSAAGIILDWHWRIEVFYNITRSSAALPYAHGQWKIDLLVYCLSTKSTSGLVLPLFVVDLVVAMEDDTESFYAKTWSNWEEFKGDFLLMQCQLFAFILICSVMNDHTLCWVYYINAINHMLSVMFFIW